MSIPNLATLIGTLGFMAVLAAPQALAQSSFSFKPVDVTLPESTETFSGPDATAINNNCLACHSTGMVLTQPLMSEAAWAAEVTKMRNVYKAPVAEADVPTIIAYLTRIKGTH